MTLFATDTEDYMTCKKRYTTNEIAFKFKGRANLNYDGGVSPDEPVPSQWEIILDRVDECESNIEGLSQDVSAIGDRVDGLSQDVSTIGDRVDTLSQDVATMGDKVDSIDSRITNNTTAIDGLSQDVSAMHGTVDNLSTELDAEKTARETADTNLQTSINDRYTNEEIDALLDTESTARTNADTRLESLIGDMYTKIETDALVNAKQDKFNDSQLAAVNSGLTSNDKTTLDGLDSRVTTNTDDIAALDEQVEELKKASGGGIDGVGAGFHSSIYRGKYLGDTYTDAQKQAIMNGTFDDLFIGDYWTINGVNWRIADFDYYYNVGDTAFTKHHVVIVPDTILYENQMNLANSVSGAYTGSKMYTTNLDEARTTFDNAFGGSYIPTHRGMYTSATTNGIPSEFAWRDMRIELMNEEQVYGHAVWGTTYQYGYDVGTQKTQFRLFALDQTKINIRQTYWLTNIASTSSFATVSFNGGIGSNPSSNSRGVRPFACLVGDSEQ
jgi:uncharacterized protein YoxC